MIYRRTMSPSCRGSTRLEGTESFQGAQTNQDQTDVAEVRPAWRVLKEIIVLIARCLSQCCRGSTRWEGTESLRCPRGKRYRHAGCRGSTRWEGTESLTRSAKPRQSRCCRGSTRWEGTENGLLGNASKLEEAVARWRGSEVFSESNPRPGCSMGGTVDPPAGGAEGCGAGMQVLTLIFRWIII